MSFIIISLEWNDVAEYAFGGMVANHDTLHGFALPSHGFKLLSGYVDFAIIVVVDCNKPIVDPNQWDVMLPASMAASLFSEASSTYAVWAPTPIWNMRHNAL